MDTHPSFRSPSPKNGLIDQPIDRPDPARFSIGPGDLAEWKAGFEWVERPARKLDAFRRWGMPLIYFFFDFAVWGGAYLFLSIFIGPGNTYGLAELTLPPIVLAMTLALVGGYKARTEMASLKYAAEHLIACIAGAIASALLLYMLFSFQAPINSSRGVFVGTCGLFLIFSLAHRRFLWFAMGRELRSRGLLVIADKEGGAGFLRALRSNRHPDDVEFLAIDAEMIGSPVLGSDSPIYTRDASNLPGLMGDLDKPAFECIVLATDGRELPPPIVDFLVKVHFQEMPVLSVQAFYETFWQKMPVHLLSPAWPLQAGFHLVKHSAYAAFKRAVDVCISALVLVLLAPLLGIIALAVKLDSPGPAIFRQLRVGQHRKIFVLLKFRTMTTGSESGSIYTSENDARITRLGRLLRKTRLDELPQLVNVLRGDMSIVGPRAEWVRCVENYENVIRHYHFRHLVRPGITGWAQVNYPYGASIEDAVEKLMFDLYYIRNFSLTLDAAVLMKTVHVMVFGKGR